METISGFDLKNRVSSFEEEARNVAGKARAKAAREHAIAARAAAKRREHEAAVAELRRRQAEEADQAELRRQADIEHNRGVCIISTLSAVPLKLDVAIAKGVKRYADKVVLPAWMSNELMKQDAAEHGLSFWRISAPDGRETHASALEFTAPEGVIMLPPKVVESLWGSEATCHGEVRVEYHRLEPGTFVRLTPESAAFQSEIEDTGADLEAVLQATLMAHSALSQGDWLEVSLPSGPQRLQVMDLEPAGAVSLVDTDLAADVTPSAEFLERMREEQLKARALEEARRALEAEEARLQADALARRQQLEAAETALAADVAQQRAIARARLPMEPSRDEGTGGLLHALFQFPDGARCARRFRMTDTVACLFDFVDAEGGGGVPPGGYRLATRFPRRVLDADADGGAALRDRQLSAGQEVFMLEARPAPPQPCVATPG